MSGEAFVAEAQEWARAVVRAECRFPGDYGPAMRRVARKACVPLGFIWNLHYRPPRSVSVEHYVNLWTYYLEQQSAYRAERSATVARTRFGEALLRAADRMAGQDDGAVT